MCKQILNPTKEHPVRCSMGIYGFNGSDTPSHGPDEKEWGAMFVKVLKFLSRASRWNLMFRRPQPDSISSILSPHILRRYCYLIVISSLTLYGCVPINDTGKLFTIPTIADPAVQGLMSYFSGLLERKDILSRRTLDDGVLAFEVVLTEAGWGKAINHSDYEIVIDAVQMHLDNPDAPYIEPSTPEKNPYPEGSWEHETFDTRHTSTCARDFPDLAKSSPELCK
jgi:hypothetical protein